MEKKSFDAFLSVIDKKKGKKEAKEFYNLKILQISLLFS